MNLTKKLFSRCLSQLLFAAGLLGGVVQLCAYDSTQIAALGGDVSLSQFAPNVFALKDELTCSWGTAKWEGNSTDKALPGDDALNQKLYFGTNIEGEPLEWWICGRVKNEDELGEAGEEPGTFALDQNGNAAVLYLAKSVYLDADNGDTKKFNKYYNSGGFSGYNRTGSSAGDDANNPVRADFLKANGTYSNLWGLSDIRARLNRGLGTPGVEPGVGADAKNGLIDTTGASLTAPSEFEAKYFKTGEMLLVLPSTVQTYDTANKNDPADDESYMYLTTDRFYLLSGNYSSSFNEFLCWNDVDVSLDTKRSSFVGDTANTDFIVPISYWSDGSISDTNVCWLRSSLPIDNSDALISIRGYYVHASSVYDPRAAAPACKINLQSVIFASAARSAAYIGGEGVNPIFEEIKGNPSATNEADQTPGMYLRFASDDVSESTISEDKKTITGRAGETITMQGFTNGKNWAYSKALSADIRRTDTISLEEVNTAGYEEGVFATDAELTSFEEVAIWGEKLGTGDKEGLLLTSTAPIENPGNGGNSPTPPGSGVTSPPTGDNLQTWMWLGGAAIGMMSVGVAISHRRYRKRGRNLRL